MLCQFSNGAKKWQQMSQIQPSPTCSDQELLEIYYTNGDNLDKFGRTYGKFALVHGIIANFDDKLLHSKTNTFELNADEIVRHYKIM